MKKISFVILVMLVIALIPAPAQSRASQAGSLFDTSDNGRGKELEYKRYTALDYTSFDTLSQGIFTLDVDTFKAQNYSGLVNVNVRCHHSYPFSYIEVYAETATGPYLLQAGTTQFVDANWTTAERQFKIKLWADSHMVIVKCRVLIEASK